MANDNDHFKFFGEALRRNLSVYGKMNDVQLLCLQRKQLETLTSLETEFKQVLIKHPWGANTYRRFTYKICHENGNVLTSRPFFRERQGTCTGPINRAIQNEDVESLYKYNFNYQFVVFVLNCRKWGKWGGRLHSIANKIKQARQDIIELNMPLALSQSRIFWSKVPAKAPYTHQQHMDFCQIAADGLISAVDKFVLPTAAEFPDEKELHEMFRKFRPMAVQRMVGNFIESYSETSIHFYPNDKKRIYRAHKFLARSKGPVDYEKVAEYVNGDIKGKPIKKTEKTTSSEIAELLSSASSVMVNEFLGEDGADTETNHLDRYSSGDEYRPDTSFEKKEASNSLHLATQTLSLLEIKLLTLKGVLT